MHKLLLFLLKRYMNGLSNQRDKLTHYIEYENHQKVKEDAMVKAYKYISEQIDTIYKAYKIIRGDKDA